MTKEKFKSLMQEAGIKSKKELAELLGLPYGSVNNWGSSKNYPIWLKNVFAFIIKAKKYDEALKRGFDESEKPKECPLNVEALSLENARLREELREYEELKRVLKRVLE
ncbi:helix-turn-helix domain containing protein [Campylobacter upsaliensis]|uniref:helix-turn-helix domain containing protein n=1 Tax=Campylobacter upsaliensis TaxID=28080 RepID=UPI00214A0128|nr:helix-turn-helix domain containing protein [Campylobacter upsaliensis]MCR2101586.1 helix-turn-helix domain containing protein [Campylobacter upsaliensis]